MSDAPVPGDTEQPVVREQVAKHIGVREDRSEHERPSHNAAPVHLGSWQVSRPVLFSYARDASRRTKQILAAKNRLPDERSRDSVRYGVHLQWRVSFFPPPSSPPPLVPLFVLP